MTTLIRWILCSALVIIVTKANAATDFGEQINTQFAACTSGCVVTIPCGTHTFSQPIVFPSDKAQLYSLKGQGETCTQLNYTGYGSAIVVHNSAGKFTILPAGVISDMTINGTSGAKAAIDFGDVIGLRLSNIRVNGFVGSTGCGIWMHNQHHWTERTNFDGVEFFNNTVGLCLSSDSGSPGSFGYTRVSDTRFNINAHQIGIKVSDTASYLYNSTITATTNMDGTLGAANFIESVRPVGPNFYQVSGECKGSSGCYLATTSGNISGYGHFNIMGTTPTSPGSSGSFRLATNKLSDMTWGSVASFAGSGRAANIYPFAVDSLDHNITGFALAEGPNIGSPAVYMYAYSGNAFSVNRVPYQGNASTSTEVAHIDESGNGVFSGGGHFGNNLIVNGSVSGTSAYVNLSDERLKKNIKPIDNSLGKIVQLHGVTFDWKAKENPTLNLSSGTDMGVVAQEVDKVFPEAVTKDKNGFLSVAYTKLIGPLIEGMKTLNDENKALKLQILDLQKRLQKLETEKK